MGCIVSKLCLGFFYIYKAPYYGVPFSHLSPELQISSIQLEISSIHLELSPIQLEIYPIQLEISTNLPI